MLGLPSGTKAFLVKERHGEAVGQRRTPVVHAVFAGVPELFTNCPSVCLRHVDRVLGAVDKLAAKVMTKDPHVEICRAMVGGCKGPMSAWVKSGHLCAVT